MKRTVMFYLRFFLMVGLLLAGAVLGADLVNYTYFPSEDALDFVFIFGSEPTKYATQALDYGRYYEITLPGSLKDVEINRFLGYSPIVGFRASSGKGVITLRFDMLLPREPEIVVVANTLRVTFYRTTVAWDEVTIYSDSAQSGSRPPLTSLLARLQKYLDVNLVIDEASIRGLQAEFVMLSESLKAEDYFFQIMMNNPSLGYAFLPNNTVYVVRKDLISEKVQEVLKEVNLSPKTDTSYWASYNFNLKKDSELFQNFSYFQDTARQQVFNKDAFTQFLIYEFGEKYAKLPSSLQNDLIVLIRGKSGPEEVSIGILLYGNPRLQEKFEYFMGFFEGMGQAGAETETAQTVTEYSQKIEYAPLSTDELRAFMTFYTKTVKDIFSPNESFPRLDTMRFEIRDANATVYIYGEEPQVKKLAQYLSDYIKDRKARGNEKMERFRVKDGAGMIFALALNRTFPKALVNFEGMSAQTQLAGKPTFEWTDKDLEELRKLQQIYDGEPDEITILGSNYEVITAKRIADDWGILVPPLESEIRMIVLSENLPDNARTALLNPDSPNSLVAKYPSVQIDPSFEPLIILRGKPQDLDTIAGYLTTLEQVWFKKPEYVEVVNVSQELMAKEADKFMTTQVKITESAGSASAQGSSATATETQSPATPSATGSTSAGKTSYIELGQVNVVASNLLSGQGDIATYLAKRWPSVNVSAVYFLDLFILRGENAADIKAAAEELRRLDWEAANETIYSELAYFEYLKAPNISLIWEQFYMKHNVKIIYIESLGAYKFYGPEKYVRAFVDELSEIDVGRIVGQPVVRTELVRINITSLDDEALDKLIAVKVPGVEIERFDPGGYFVTGTEEQISKTKDFLNLLTSDFIEDSTILQIAKGVTFETVEKVLGLYFSKKELEILDLTDSKFIIKGQKERTDNAKLILRSFELIDNIEGMEPPYVQTLDFQKIAENAQKEWSSEDILQMLYSSYPNVKINYLSSSQTFLFVGRKNDVLSAIADIESLPQKPLITRNFTFSNTAFPFQNPLNKKKISVEGMIAVLKSSEPGVAVTVYEDGTRFSTLELRGKENSVENALYLLTSAYPPVILNDEKTTFNLQATGQDVLDITDLIVKDLQPTINVFVPERSLRPGYRSYSSYETTESTQTCSFHLENLSWTEWVNILKRVYGFKIDTFSTNSQTLTILIPPGVTYEPGADEIRVLRTDYGYEEALNLIQSPIFDGTGYMDKEKGYVVFTGISDQKMENFMTHLFDVVKQTPPMVEITVLIVDDDLLGDFQTGANITLSASPMLDLSTDGGLNFTASLLDLANSAKILESLTRNVRFNLSMKGKTSDEDSLLKTAPFLSTLSGKTATIRIGESVSFIRETLVGTATESQTITFNPGYNLSITPSVRSDERILLSVDINISNQTVNLLSLADYSENTRNVQTEVILKNRETLIIGGLEGTASTSSMTKVPFLGDLPFVGHFFRREGKNDITRSVSIFITPSIRYVDPQTPRITVENININTIGYLK